MAEPLPHLHPHSYCHYKEDSWEDFTAYFIMTCGHWNISIHAATTCWHLVQPVCKCILHFKVPKICTDKSSCFNKIDEYTLHSDVTIGQQFLHVRKKHMDFFFLLSSKNSFPLRLWKQIFQTWQHCCGLGCIIYFQATLSSATEPHLMLSDYVTHIPLLIFSQGGCYTAVCERRYNCLDFSLDLCFILNWYFWLFVTIFKKPSCKKGLLSLNDQLILFLSGPARSPTHVYMLL